MLPARRVRSTFRMALVRGADNIHSHPLQIEARHGRHHHSDSRFQRRDRHLQEHQIQRVGRRWTRQDQTAVEALLLRHTRTDLRH